MMRAVIALICGSLFGVGLTVSQMTDPEKVLGFLNVFGVWDPTLVMVMAGALIVTWLGYHLTFKMEKPVWDNQFNIPESAKIDWPLMAGSMLFGLGWGLSGYCPGPAIANLVINTSEAIYFLVSMLLGFIIAHLIKSRNNAVMR